MPHGTPLHDKAATLLVLLSEHAQTQNSDTFCLPMSHLYAKGLDISDVNNLLWSWRDKGIIKSYLHGWGSYESEEGSPRTFVISSTEEVLNDGDFEAYKIEIQPKKFGAYLSEQQPSQNAGKIVLRLSKDGDLYKEPREKFSYPMSKKGVPMKLVRYFADTLEGEYQETDSIAESLNMAKQAVRTEIGKLRKAVKKPLGLEKIDVIETKRHSGYRLNPHITIRLEE